MKPLFIACIILLATVSCTKEQPKTTPQEETVPASEIKALRQELEELKSTVAALTPSTQEPGVSVDEFNALKKENEDLKAKVELLMSDFFEVEGLRFDKNGTLISVPKLESEVVEDAGYIMGSVFTLTTTRTYDAEGRVIEIYRNYNTRSEWASIPYYWQKVFYEYNGKSCKTTTQTNKYGLGAGVPYEEEVVETTYW